MVRNQLGVVCLFFVFVLLLQGPPLKKEVICFQTVCYLEHKHEDIRTWEVSEDQTSPSYFLIASLCLSICLVSTYYII